MRDLFFYLLFSASLLTAQAVSVDSTKTGLLQDSVSISDLVQRQIEKAKESRSQQIVANVSEAGINFGPARDLPQPWNYRIINFYKTLPLQLQIFFAASFLILFTISIRRAVYMIKRRSSRALKSKITMLREEKVVSKTDSKLNKTRKKLLSSKLISNVPDSRISKMAKGLNIATGELQLASRLKLFEIGEM